MARLAFEGLNYGLKLAVQTWWFHFCLSRYLTSLLAIVNFALGLVYLPREYSMLFLFTRAEYVMFTLVELQFHDSLFPLGEAMIHGVCAQTSKESYTLVWFVVSDTAKLGTDFFLLVSYAPYLAWTPKQWEDSRYVSFARISPVQMSAGFPWLYMSMILLL
ncbi:hypothetical protein KC332_g9353 [Hortaea werneckii]|nr:hypothetical protein KC358_g9166 [Hortaea werneckii]KAI6851954.1 hypothetical protein KC350_g1320 [Hortaea werneckii]KAI6923561.1 hypothetical protein KC348_g9489 [Hortaea werneckii]KAI6932618.1 hypothetical protein KC341_g8874 [Hortaea werneckii]KAI6966938.1 hypothetical protein KC321_g9292 [Hortaea werneckii]